MLVKASRYGAGVGWVPLPAGGPFFAPRFPQTSSWRSLVVRTVGRNRWAVAAAMLAVASACSEPQSPESVTALLLQQGYPLAVTVTTTGSDVDPDGYTIWVDASQRQPDRKSTR